MTNATPSAANDSFMASHSAKMPYVILGIYAVSFSLPALINPHPTEYSPRVVMWGWEAAILSMRILVIPLYGLVLAPSNPCFLFAWLFWWGKRYRTAFVLASIAVLSMIGSAIIAPNRPSDGPISTPGGRMGIGYYLWLTAGVGLLILAGRQLIDHRKGRGRSSALSDSRP